MFLYTVLEIFVTVVGLIQGYFMNVHILLNCVLLLLLPGMLVVTCFGGFCSEL